MWSLWTKGTYDHLVLFVPFSFSYTKKCPTGILYLCLVLYIPYKKWIKLISEILSCTMYLAMLEGVCQFLQPVSA